MADGSEASPSFAVITNFDSNYEVGFQCAAWLAVRPGATKLELPIGKWKNQKQRLGKACRIMSARRIPRPSNTTARRSMMMNAILGILVS